MPLSVTLSGTLQAVDSSTGTVQFNKQISVNLASGTTSAYAESLLVGTGTTTISLPISPAQCVYIKNLHASQTVTVTWTPNGGSTATILTLQPQGAILFLEANTSSGITALTMTASGASTPVDYVVAG